MPSQKLLRLLLLVMLFFQWTKVVCSETTKTLNYKIIKKETLKKGGQRYDFIKTYAALQKNEKLTEKNIKAVLKKIISEIRALDNPYGIVVYLHQSKNHIKGGNNPLAIASWWPKEHSFSPDNVSNIENKSTHETTYSIDLPQKVDERKVVTRLSESKRREIFTELVRSEDKAQAEADAKYDTYDFSAIRKNIEKADHLSKEYRKELLKKFQITEEELQKISTEAFMENWLMPSLKANAQTKKPLTIGISYNQIMEYLDQYISMSKSSDVRGQTSYMGQTSDNLAILEIIGNKKDVSQATLMIGIPNDAPKILVRNTAILLRFMKNIAPEWKSGSDWATSALKRISSTGEPEEIIRGSKSIKLSLIKVLGIVSVTVKHKNTI